MKNPHKMNQLAGVTADSLPNVFKSSLENDKSSTTATSNNKTPMMIAVADYYGIRLDDQDEDIAPSQVPTSVTQTPAKARNLVNAAGGIETNVRSLNSNIKTRRQEMLDRLTEETEGSTMPERGARATHRTTVSMGF